MQVTANMKSPLHVRYMRERQRERKKFRQTGRLVALKVNIVNYDTHASTPQGPQNNAAPAKTNQKTKTHHQ